MVTFNARNEHDRCKFAEDLRESISEMDEMEQLRIEAELERQKSARSSRNGGSASSENRDSGRNIDFLLNIFRICSISDHFILFRCCRCRSLPMSISITTERNAHRGSSQTQCIE